MYLGDHVQEAIPPAGGIGRQRTSARVGMVASNIAGRTAASQVAESGSLRVRFPNTTGGALEAVLLNTAGGIACGDDFRVSIDVCTGAALVLTSSAAERIYRSDGATAEYNLSLKVQTGGTLCWLPQETILFNRARLRRRFEVEVSRDASFLSFEAVVFGRVAHSEDMAEGMLEDVWRIRSDDRLIYADTFRLSGAIADLLHKPTVAKGARVMATCLYIAPDAEARLARTRDLLSSCTSECAASAWNGLLAMRFLAVDIKTLRSDAIAFLTAFRGEPMPRVWH